MKSKRWICLFGCALCLASARSGTFDLILRNGVIIDGAGNPARHADIGIVQGRIARIGHFAESGPIERDVRGLVIAPGFIDVHTHAENVDQIPSADNFVRMGVTTIVLGNCGWSVLHPAELFQRLKATPASVNVATLIGHGTIRSQAMGGSFMRPPSSQELEAMKSAINEAMQEGALGISTGLIYLPGIFAQTDELIELARVASRFDGIYVSHMRDEGIEIFSALRELFRIAREAQIPAHISHIKLSSKAAWGNASTVLDEIEKARSQGLDITQDVYVYTASSTGLAQLIPEEARQGETGEFEQLLNDPLRKAELARKMTEKLTRRGDSDYQFAVIAHYAYDAKLDGKTIPEAVRFKGGAGSLEEQIELIMEIYRHGGASGIFHGISEPDLRTFLGHPNTMFASDSEVRRFGEGVPHPRGYGNNARVLARCVRELKLLRLEEAIRRMTFLPATTFHLAGRGILQENAWADMVLFDPSEIQDQATFGDPHRYPSGIDSVYVNGRAVYEKGQMTSARPGQIVRRGKEDLKEAN